MFASERMQSQMREAFGRGLAAAASSNFLIANYGY